MSWDLDTAKIYLGISGSENDESLQAAMDTTLAAVETVLARSILFSEDTATFYQEHLQTILLPKFPVKQVLTVGGETMDDTWLLNSSVGTLLLPCMQYFSELSIVYEGGYETLPLDLERAMYEALAYLWGQTNPDTGAPENGGLETDPGGASGEVSRVTIQDFGSVSFDTGAGLSGEAASKATEVILDWGWLYPWSGTLQFYRSEQGTGLGIA